ncbi:MAG: hypothetical protein HXY40_13395 [Chloroflexi bacterium]|nr:hypothetical protein [Chloroflexota bacterium]
MHQPTPFHDRAQAVLTAWRIGTLSFVEAVESFNALKYEALQDSSAVNEALVERLMGIVRIARGHYAHAIRHFRMARELYEIAEEPELMLLCDNNMAEAYRQRGDLERAHSIFVRTNEAAQKHDFMLVCIYCQANDGRTLIGLERFAEGLTTLEAALTLARTPQIEPQVLGLIALIHCDMTIALLQLGRPQAAYYAAREALVSAELSKEVRRRAQAHRALGRALSLYTPPQTTDSADAQFEASISLCRETRLDIELALSLAAHGESLLKRGQSEAAGARFQDALALYEQLGFAAEIQKTRQILAALVQKDIG